MIRLLFVVAALAGCKKSDDKPWIPDPNAPPTISDAEIKRGKDACTTYVTKICACAKAKPELANQCQLAKGYPEAIEAGLYVSGAQDSTKKDVVSTVEATRKAMAKCIEESAKLPPGC